MIRWDKIILHYILTRKMTPWIVQMPCGWDATYRLGNLWPHWRPLSNGYLMYLQQKKLSI